MLADPTARCASTQQAKNSQKRARRKGISADVVRLVARGMQAAFDGDDDLADMYFLAAETAVGECVAGLVK